MRSIWKGAITFGLVNVPVKVYSATEDHDVSLHQVHDADGGRIRYQRRCEICGNVVEYANIAKAFDDGERTVVLTEADLWRGAARHGADGRPVPLWLVVHGGPEHEVDELLAYARSEARHEHVEPRLVLVAPGRADTRDGVAPVPVLDAVPAAPLFGRVDRVFTGGGFNAVREAVAAGVEHRALPFPRRFDDQYRRVARARAASGSGSVRPSGP